MKEKAWNVLVCLAGDNNLTEEMVWSLQEMKKACSKEAVYSALNVVALFDPRGERPRTYKIVLGDEHPSENDGDLAARVDEETTENRILERAHALSVEEFATALGLDPSQDFKELGEKLAALGLVALEGSVSALVEAFLLDRVEILRRSGPHRYAVILSGHGSGAVGDFLSDEQPKSSMGIPRLGRILELIASELKGNGHKEKIQILGMDSCLMSTVEVAYEVQRSVEYLVASEGSVKNTGWPYHRILEAFSTSGGVVEYAAHDIADSYIRFYRDYEVAGVSTDIAVCALAHLGLPSEPEPEEGPAIFEDEEGRKLAARIQNLASVLIEFLNEVVPDGLEEALELDILRQGNGGAQKFYARDVRDAIVMAHWNAQPYLGNRYVDLYDFCEQLQRCCPKPPAGGRRRDDQRFAGAIHTACEDVLTAMKSVAPRSRFAGSEFQHSHGLSIYFPWSASEYVTDYRRLRFARHTRWAEFLETYLKVTARMRRNQGIRVEPVFPGPAPFGITRSDRQPVTAIEPIRRGTAFPILAHSGADTNKHPPLGTDRHPPLGTDRGEVCSSMRNPPDGYYEDTQNDHRDERQERAENR